jgi:Leucine-rich repeat (LRR) protein
MSNEKEAGFDPYHRWLGIPRDQRPPTHYQMLGLAVGESDLEVIEDAAIRQSSHVRSYQIGPHASSCTRLLNEISLARQVLVNPQKKKEYDQSLAPPAASPAPPPPITAITTDAVAGPSPFNDLDQPATTTPRHEASREARREAPKSGKLAKRKSGDDDPTRRWILLGGVGGTLLLGVIVIVIVLATRRPEPSVAQSGESAKSLQKSVVDSGPKPTQVDPKAGDPKAGDPKAGVSKAKLPIDPKPKTTTVDPLPTTPAIDPKPNTPPATPKIIVFLDRRAAHWAMSIGGKVRINGEVRDRLAVDDLPEGPFQLTSMNLTRIQQVNDDGLSQFKDCKDLVELYLDYTSVTDAGLAQLGGLEKLKVLNLGRTKVTETGLTQLKACRNLISLNLNGLPVTAAGLDTFKDCDQLTDLHLSGTRIGDADVPAIARFTSLFRLDLGNTRVSDVGLRQLEGLSKLSNLNLKKTTLSASAVQKLATALPGCTIEADVLSDDPMVAELADRRAAQWMLTVGGSVRSKSGKLLNTIADLPEVRLPLKEVDFRSSRQVSDEGLAVFRECTNVTNLDFSGINRIGDAGLVHFANCRDLFRLSLSGTRVTDEGLKAFKDFTKLKYVWLQRTQVTGSGLVHLKKCQSLTELYLNGSKVNDAGLAPLKAIPGLKRVTLQDTEVTAAGIAALASAMPALKIDR